MIVCFVDIVEIDDHHCLNFLFIKLVKFTINKRLRILKGKSKLDNTEKLATQGTQHEEKNKHNNTQTKS